MKIAFRTVKNKEFEVEIEESSTVAELISLAVEGFKPEFQEDAVILVCKGKILARDKTAGSYGLKDRDRIVIMSQKKKDIGKTPPLPTKPPTPAKLAPTGTTTDTAAKTPNVEVPKPDGSTKEIAKDSPESNAVQPASEESTAGGLEILASMGFDRESAKQFLTMANGNVDMAAALLVNDDVRVSRGGDQPLSTTDTADADAADSGETIPLSGVMPDLSEGEVFDLPVDHPLYEFTSSDAFGEMRRQVQRNPSSLPSFIHQIMATNPELGRHIITHEEDFLKCLLGEELAATRQDSQSEESRMLEEAIGSFTVEDMASIDRLCELGFDKFKVIEAYIACDKNEEHAANFLFDDAGEVQ